MRVPPSKRSRYEEFVAANGDGLVRLAYAICGDRGRAEDAGQEALIGVYQPWSRLTDPLAYARRTAINATRADWRRSMRADRAHRDAARLPSTDADDPQETESPSTPRPRRAPLQRHSPGTICRVNG